MEKLKNSYFILRHGHSKANEAGIILSNLEDGKLNEFSLTPEGEAQVEASVAKVRSDYLFDENTIIVSSPFSRCRRTAEIAKEVTGSGQITFDDRIRERWFGNWERQSTENYKKVWEIDKVDANHKIELVESAQEVQDRMVAVIKDLELKYQEKRILLVSHGDALQILQTWFSGVPATNHRVLSHLETAEVRKLN